VSGVIGVRLSTSAQPKTFGPDNLAVGGDRYRQARQILADGKARPLDACPPRTASEVALRPAQRQAVDGTAAAIFVNGFSWDVDPEGCAARRRA